MDFLNTCTTNAHALAHVDAVAFAAFSLTRTATTIPREWTPAQDLGAVEAHLRQAAHWVTQDATRPWLWLFKPLGPADDAEQTAAEPPGVPGYRFQRELAGRVKAAELARPPMMRPAPTTATATVSPASAPAPQKAAPSGAARLPPPPTHSQANNPPDPTPPDCLTIYHLLIASVIGLISYTLVRDCDVVALNYRTFVSRPTTRTTSQDTLVSSSRDLHWLTSIAAHWTSSGTFLLSTITQGNHAIRCLDRVEQVIDREQLLGRVIRVAPNGLLATIVAWDDPLDSVAADNTTRQKKRPRTTTLEPSIAKWKSTVTRWLAWRGFALPDLEKRVSWVRIRSNHPASPTASIASSPTSPSPEWDLLWPRALCYLYDVDRIVAGTGTGDGFSTTTSNPQTSMLKWFQTADSPGFRDPLDAAQDWAAGKADRDKLLDTQRKAKLAEEEAVRRKEEQASLFPSSPRNTRNVIYGDLHAGNTVYPTPPDGIVPSTGPFQSDTPSVTGAATNVILAPGGTTPAINLSAPQEHGQTEATHESLSTAVLPSATEHFHTSGGNDDLFGDLEEEGYEGDNINEEDFDFFDAPDDEDVDMLDAPALSRSKVVSVQEASPLQPTVAPKSQSNRDNPVSSAALESALITASPSTQNKIVGGNSVQVSASEIVPASTVSDTIVEPQSQLPKDGKKSGILHEAMPISQPLQSVSAQETVPREREEEQTPDRSRDGAFDPLHFSRKMSLTDAKYQDGRFAVSRENATIIERRASLKRNAEPKSLRDIPLMTKLRYSIGVASTAKIPEITSLALAASDDSDSTSTSATSEASDDDSEEETDASPMAFFSGLNMPTKRKLPTDGNATPMSVTSYAESWGGDWHDLQGLQLDETHLSSFEPSSWDWSLVFAPSPAERSALGARFSMPALPPSMQMPDTPTSQPDVILEVAEDKSSSGKDSIIIAQIVTDQLMSATLDILYEDAPSQTESEESVASESRWHAAIKTLFPDATECTVATLAAVNDVFPDFQTQGKGQQRPPPRKQNEGAAPGSQMFQLNPPFLRVRRADTHWDLLPPAVAFWEHLGLSPASPCKNVVAFCIYPHSESLRPYLEGFLLNLQLAYDSCKLGSHSRVETVVEFEGGLVPWKLTTTPNSEREVLAALKDTCVQLGKVLALQHAKIQEQQDGKMDAFVIYIVDPFGDPSALWDLCQSFWALFQAYGQGSPGRPDAFPKPDLVLQVVPIKYIASFDAPVILDPSTYINLAREVYDRCPPNAPSGDKTCLSIYNAPAFQLEETIPRSIPFKLLSEPPQDLLRENCYMHLGYAISLDGTWITAAWTDTCGKSQTVVSYHFGTRVFGEIAKEIWQTTMEILQSRRVHWRVCIAKGGVMEKEELDTWVLLLSYPAQLNLFITLLSVDTRPPLKFTPTMPPITTMPASTTPISTPQPGVSPDPTAGLTPAATPSADAPLDPSLDPDARLIDVTDETWGITLAHRLHNSNSTNHFSPALISGLLVKRGQTSTTIHSITHPIPDPLPGPIVIAVNILWIGAVGTTRTASPFSPTDSASPLSTSSPSPSLPLSSSSSSSSPYTSIPLSQHQHAQHPPTPNESTATGPRNTSSLMWTPTAQTRSTAENLLKEILAQFRALGLLARLRGMRGSRHGSVPWHLVAAERGVLGLERVVSSR